MNCQVSHTPQGPFGPSLEGLTVGEKFYLQCSNANSMENIISNNLTIEDISIILKDHPWSQYILKPLKIISSSDSDQVFLIEVTSYIPGNYNQGLFLQKDQTLIELKGISWQVKSSLPQKASHDTSQIQINPLYGFVKMPLPYWEIALWIGSLLLLLGSFIWIARKMHKRKKEFNDIANLKTLRSPIYEFHHKAKQLEKKYLNMPTTLNSGIKNSLLNDIQSSSEQEQEQKQEQESQQVDQDNRHTFCVKLNNIFRRFLAVEMHFPAHIWSLQKSSKYLKKAKLHSELLNRIKNMLYELDRSSQSTKDIPSQEECYQNLSLSKSLANEIASQKKKDNI